MTGSGIACTGQVVRGAFPLALSSERRHSCPVPEARLGNSVYQDILVQSYDELHSEGSKRNAGERLLIAATRRICACIQVPSSPRAGYQLKLERGQRRQALSGFDMLLRGRSPCMVSLSSSLIRFTVQPGYCVPRTYPLLRFSPAPRVDVTRDWTERNELSVRQLV